MPIKRGKASPSKEKNVASPSLGQHDQRRIQSPSYASSPGVRKRGRTTSAVSEASTTSNKYVPKRSRAVKEEVEDDFIDVDSDIPSTSSLRDNSVRPTIRGKAIPSSLENSKSMPSPRRGLSSKLPSVKEEFVEFKPDVSSGNHNDSATSRHSRVRQPSRKLLEMQQTETLLRQQITPIRKKRFSESSQQLSTKMATNLESEVADSPMTNEDLDQPTSENVDANSSSIQQCELDEYEQSNEDAGQLDYPDEIASTPVKTSLSQVPFNQVHTTTDLPEEHRPKDKARPVVLDGSLMKRRPYFAPAHSHNGENMPGPSNVDLHHDDDFADIVVQEVDIHSSMMDGDLMERVRNGEYTIVDENGKQIVYEMGEGDYVEEVDLDEMTDDLEILEEREIKNPDGTTSIIQSVAPREPPKIENQSDLTVKPEPVNNDEEDDDAPPRLVPEMGPTGDERPPRRVDDLYMESDNVIRVHSPGGTAQFVHVERGEDGTEIYIDANGDEVQMIEEPPVEDLRTVEFNFLDNKNVCCGLCGEIVAFESLMSHHLPQMHPEILTADGDVGLEEIPYQTWLKDKLYTDKKNLEGGFRSYDAAITNDDLIRIRGHRPLRKVSQIRVNPIEMSLAQLDSALKKKMIEKMGRKVAVSLVDKQHARCGECNAVVSLNKKFEIVHLVRHFNAWHPSLHRCAGTWQKRPVQAGVGKPLSIQDFAVIDVSLNAPDNLQCIWCGMFMDRDALAMHFTEVHPDEIEVPKCLLCLQELVINARLLEKYGEDFDIVLPDEFHLKCGKFDQRFKTESSLDRAIGRRVQKMQNSGVCGVLEEEEEEVENPVAMDHCTNSRMQFGRRNKPKRSFVQPFFRQAIPINSQYVEAVSECQWKCKLCNGNIFGAVISAGAIKHFKQAHPGEMENMQYELCKARLERVSDGCMEFVHPQLVECLLCNLTYALHKPYNMCRGIRHLKTKHPEMMPEFAATGAGRAANHHGKLSMVDASRKSGIKMGETIEDPEMLARFKNEYNVDFDKVQTVFGADGEPVYVLLGEGEELDPETAMQVASSLDEGDEVLTQSPDENSFDEDEMDNYEMQQDVLPSRNRPQTGPSKIEMKPPKEDEVIDVLVDGEINGDEMIEYIDGEEHHGYEEVYDEGEIAGHEVYVTDDSLPPEEYLEQDVEYIDSDGSHFVRR